MYRKGMDFPYEGFVQHAIEAHFDMSGYLKEHIPFTDYAGFHSETGEKWRIETKGLTSQCGLDFRTGLGQLIQRMDDPNALYGIAIPNIPQYLNQVKQILPWVRERFQLHVWLVDEDGGIRHITPYSPLE